MTRRAGARGLRWRIAVLSLCALGLGQLGVSDVRADGIRENPLAAMRAAAQEAADTEPDPARWTRKVPAPTGRKSSDALRGAIRSAVRDEVSRVAAERTIAPGRSGNTPATDNGNGKGSGNANSERHGPSELGLLHSAVSSAQQAKRNVDVQVEHGNGIKAHGNSGPPSQNKESLPVGAAKR